MKEVCRKSGTIGFLPSMITCNFEDCMKALEVVKTYVD